MSRLIDSYVYRRPKVAPPPRGLQSASRHGGKRLPESRSCDSENSDDFDAWSADQESMRRDVDVDGSTTSMSWCVVMSHYREKRTGTSTRSHGNMTTALFVVCEVRLR